MQEQLFEGRYRLLAELSNTRSYVTYRAHDQASSKLVELQIYGRASAALDEKLSSYQIDNYNLFLQNAQQLKRLNEQAPGSYFQPMLDCSLSSSTRQIYTVYQHIEGSTSLNEIAARLPYANPGSPNLTEEDSLEERVRQVLGYMWVLEQAAVALDYAYQKNTPHNNITMNAILVAEASGNSRTGTVWLTDFDLSASTPNMNARIGQGWSLYASPEQRSGLPTSRSSDIFAFAAVAYELVFGLPPNPPYSPQSNSTPESVIIELLQRFPKTKGILADVFDKALRFNPLERYQTALEFVTELKKGLEVWQRDWEYYKRALLVRGRQNPEQYRDALLGLYTLDSRNREAWKVAELQEELNVEMSSLPSNEPFRAYAAELTAPPPGVVVEGYSNNQLALADSGDIFEYRNEIVPKAEAQIQNPVNLITDPNDKFKFRPSLPINATNNERAIPQNIWLLLVVPLVIFIVAAVVIFLLINNDDNPVTPTALVSVTVPIRTGLPLGIGAATATVVQPQVNTPIVPTQSVKAPVVAPTVQIVNTLAPPTNTPVSPTNTPVPVTPTPSAFELNYQLGFNFLQQGNFGAAKEPLTKALADQPTNKNAQRANKYADGGLALGDNDFEKSVGLFEGVFGEDQNYLNIQEYLQQALIGYADNLRGSNPGEALKHYQQAATLNGSRKDEANKKAAELPKP